jgi:hypothetical protein
MEPIACLELLHLLVEERAVTMLAVLFILLETLVVRVEQVHLLVMVAEVQDLV